MISLFKLPFFIEPEVEAGHDQGEILARDVFCAWLYYAVMHTASLEHLVKRLGNQNLSYCLNFLGKLKNV